MAPKWMDAFRAANEGGTDDIEIKPEDIKRLSQIPEDFGTQFKALQDSNTKTSGTLDEVLAFVRDQRKAEQDRTDAAKAERERKAAERANAPLDFENDFEGSLKRTLDPIAENQLRINARDLRRQILDEDPEFAEYYTGELKAKVNAIIEAEPLRNQNSPELIRNAYKTVAFDFRKEIEEKKIKSRFLATSQGSSGTGASGTKPETGTPESLNDEERSFIRKMGITAEAYAKSKKDLGYV